MRRDRARQLVKLLEDEVFAAYVEGMTGAALSLTLPMDPQTYAYLRGKADGAAEALDALKAWAEQQQGE